jgi:hypothetical protein
MKTFLESGFCGIKMPCLHVENLRYIGIAHLKMQLGNKQLLKTLYVPKIFKLNSFTTFYWI